MKFKCPECQEVCEFTREQLGEQTTCIHCYSEFNLPSQEVAPGSIIGDYEVKKEIGQGRYGKVFYAYDLTLDRDIALKVLLKRYSRDSNFIAAFFKEARSVAQLNHPNIVQAYKVSEEDGLYYQAMEFIEGGSLRDWLEQNETLPFTFAVPLIHQVVEALNFAYSESKIFHDDVKPENILINTRNQVKVSDLGLAKTEGMYDDTYSSFYMSPEEVLGSKTDSRSDIYCLGIVLYEMLVGKVPFKGENSEEVKQKHIKQQLAFPLNKAASKKVPLALRSILLKMMAKHPDDRYESMAALSEDLKYFKKNHNCSNDSIKAFKSKGFKAAKSKVLRNKTVKKKSKFPAVPVISGLVIVIVLMLAVVVLYDEKETASTDQKDEASARQAFLIREIADFQSRATSSEKELREIRDLTIGLLKTDLRKDRQKYEQLLVQLDDELIYKQRLLAMAKAEEQQAKQDKIDEAQKVIEEQLQSFDEATSSFRLRFVKQYSQSLNLKFMSEDLSQLKVRNSKADFFQWKSDYADLVTRVSALLDFLKTNEEYKEEVLTIGSTTKKFSAYKDGTLLVQEVDIVSGELESESRENVYSLPLKALDSLFALYESDEIERQDSIFATLLWAQRFDEAEEFLSNLEGYDEWKVELATLKTLQVDNLDK